VFFVDIDCVFINFGKRMKFEFKTGTPETFGKTAYTGK